MPAQMNQESKVISLDQAFKVRLDRRRREIQNSYRATRASWSPWQRSEMENSKWEEENETETFQSDLEDQLTSVKAALKIPFEIIRMNVWAHFDSWDSINKKDLFNENLRHLQFMINQLNRVFESLMANANVFLDDELEWLFADFLLFVSYRQIERERYAEFVRQFMPHMQKRIDQGEKVVREGWSALLPLVVSRIFAKKPSAEELAFVNDQYAVSAREVSKIQRVVFNAYNELGANAVNWPQFKQFIDQSRAAGMSYPTSIDHLLRRKLGQIPTLK